MVYESPSGSDIEGSVQSRVVPVIRVIELRGCQKVGGPQFPSFLLISKTNEFGAGGGGGGDGDGVGVGGVGGDGEGGGGGGGVGEGATVTMTFH